MHNKRLIIQLNIHVSKTTHSTSNWFCIDKNTRRILGYILPFRITWSCIRLSFLLRLFFGSFSNDFRHFILSLTVLLYLFWHSRFEQSFVLSPIAMTFVIDSRNPHWAIPNVIKVFKSHIDRYNKVKHKTTIQSEQFPNLIGKSYKQRQSR